MRKEAEVPQKCPGCGLRIINRFLLAAHLAMQRECRAYCFETRKVIEVRRDLKCQEYDLAGEWVDVLPMTLYVESVAFAPFNGNAVCFGLRKNGRLTPLVNFKQKKKCYDWQSKHKAQELREIQNVFSYSNGKCC